MATDPTPGSLKGCWHYHLENLSEALEKKDRVMTGLVAAIGAIGLLLLGIEALAPGIHFPWHESAIAPFAGFAAAGYAVWHFVFWRPYRRHENQKRLHQSEIDRLNGEIGALKATRQGKLAFGCGEGIPFPTVRRDASLFNQSTGQKIGSADLFGFSVTNNGPGIVIKCCAVLDSIEREGTVLCSDKSRLPFEPLNAGPDQEFIDLHPHISQRASICSIKDDETVHAGTLGALWRYPKFGEYFKDEGDYTIRVIVSAENHDPVHLEFKFHRAAIRSNSKIELGLGRIRAEKE